MEQKDNNVALFENKKQNDKQPDYRGKGMVNGKEVQVSAWKRVASNGGNYLSLSFQEPFKGEKKEQVRQESVSQKTVNSYEGMDDDIPF